MADKKRVLITGAAGRIGSELRKRLRDHFELRLLDIRPMKDEGDAIVADIRDRDAMLAACGGMEAVVHLAGVAGEGDFLDDLLPMNIVGVYVVFSAACEAGVKTIVFASTNHVIGGYERDHFQHGKEIYVTDDMPIRPDSHYAVTKCFGEALGRYYHEAFGVRVVCFRIGSFLSQEELAQRASKRTAPRWLSPRDFSQLVRLAIEHKKLGFEIFNAISDNTGRYWDIERAKNALGYEPEDDGAAIL